MAFFDNLKDKAKDLAQSGIEKSKQLSEIEKLNLNNVAEEDTIKKLVSSTMRSGVWRLRQLIQLFARKLPQPR